MDAKWQVRSYITIDDGAFLPVLPCQSLERLGGSRARGPINEACKQHELAYREIFADISIDYVLYTRTGTHALDDMAIGFQSEQHLGTRVAQLVMNLSLI